MLAATSNTEAKLQLRKHEQESGKSSGYNLQLLHVFYNQSVSNNLECNKLEAAPLTLHGVLCTKRPKMKIFIYCTEIYAIESDWLKLADQIQPTWSGNSINTSSR